MYVKLGTIKSKQLSTENSDFMIFAGVPSSALSYERPVVLRSAEELEAWFGKNFPEYSYYRELLLSGVSLYLFKPIAPPSGSDPARKVAWYMSSGGQNIPFPSVNFLKVFLESGGTPRYTGSGTEIKYNVDGRYYIKEESYGESGKKTINFIALDELPSAGDWRNTSSLLNRDTLVVSIPSGSYFSPKYSGGGTTTRYTKITFPSGGQSSSKKWYFAFEIPNAPSDKYKKYGLYNFDVGSDEALQAMRNKGVEYYNGGHDNLTIDGFVRWIENRKVPITIEAVVGNSCYISPVLPILFNVSDLVIEEVSSIPGFIDPTSEGLFMPNTISFWSKTIGKDANIYDEEEARIKVTIEKVYKNDEDSGIYRVTLKRFGYGEVFEGNVWPGIGEEGLGSLISRKSKLVYCEISDPNHELRNGLEIVDVEMKNAEVEENVLPTWYYESLSAMFDTSDDGVFPDFLLIPEISLWPGATSNTYIGSYAEILKRAAEEYNMQILVHESDFNDIERNSIYLPEDLENRLIYFYGDIYLPGEDSRPAYYPFIRNILENKHSFTEEEIVDYIQNKSTENYINNIVPYPTKEDTKEGLIKILEDNRCNYLVCNNQRYYYKSYLKDFLHGSKTIKGITSPLMRFAMGKVYRELMKNKWNYLGKKNEVEIKDEIRRILNTVSEFSMISSIEIDQFSLNKIRQELYLVINVRVRDLLESDMTLDITVNYNKYNNFNNYGN